MAPKPTPSDVQVLALAAETMFDRLRRLYCAGSLSEAGLATAVERGWITQAQMDQILTECPNA